MQKFLLLTAFVALCTCDTIFEYVSDSDKEIESQLNLQKDNLVKNLLNSTSSELKKKLETGYAKFGICDSEYPIMIFDIVNTYTEPSILKKNINMTIHLSALILEDF